MAEHELCAWLDSTAPENAAYFERLMALYAVIPPISPLYISPYLPISPLYLPYISFISRLHLHVIASP